MYEINVDDLKSINGGMSPITVHMIMNVTFYFHKVIARYQV